MTSRFKIIISSDVAYTELCAEIFFNDQFVGILTQEDGFENLKIEIHPPENINFWTFDLAEFETILNSAKRTLSDMRKNEP